MDATSGAWAPGRTRSKAPGSSAPGPATPSPWPPGLDESHEPTRLVDFLLGGVVLVAVGAPGVPASLGVGLVAVAALVAAASVRRPTRRLLGLGWLPAVGVATIAYLVLVSAWSPDDSLYGWPKRAMRLGLLVLFLLAMVTGRVHLPSVVRGAAAGLVVNLVLFYAGLTPARYGDLLTGLLLDKNQAGLSYTVVGLLALGVMGRRRDRVLIVLGISGSVWATGSRTSLAALACGLVWFAVRARTGLPLRLVTLGLMAAAIPFVEENYARAGAFAARVGSDGFRMQIDALAGAKLETAPFQGLGLGEAWVVFPDGDVFFFHNSYWSALLEGGWPYLVVLVGAHVLIGIRPWRVAAPPTRLALAGECANIAVLVCALRLGEVFATTTGMLALAVGIVGWMQAEHLRRTAAAARTRGALDRAPLRADMVAR